jgi:hypothetical protein
LFRWVDAVDVIERALAELNETDQELAARLEGEMVVAGLLDARRASRVAPVVARLGSRGTEADGEPLAVAQALAMLLAGRPASQTAALLEEALARAGPGVENWDTRAALLWVLVAVERFTTVEESLKPMLAEVHRSGSARGFVATYSTTGLLKLRLGALPEADAAARVALRVLQEGDFAPGLGFAATVLADIAVEAGEPGEAQALLDLLPQRGGPRDGARCSSRLPADACGWPKAVPPTRWPTSRPAPRYLPTRCGACQPARRDTCTHARARRSHW